MVCDNGTIGAPAAPCAIRHRTSVSSDCDMPHIKVAAVNRMSDHNIRFLVPKRATNHPVIGVTTAVARMLKVMTQAISS